MLENEKKKNTGQKHSPIFCGNRPSKRNRFPIIPK